MLLKLRVTNEEKLSQIILQNICQSKITTAHAQLINNCLVDTMKFEQASKTVGLSQE